MQIKTILISGLLITCILTGCSGKTATADTLEAETTTAIESTIDITNKTSELESTIEVASTTSETEINSTEIESTTNVPEEGIATYTITGMDKTMYAANDCNVRKGPDANVFEKVGELNQNEEVQVTGKVNEVNWYRISLANGSEAYVSGTFLSDTKQSTTSDNGNSQVQQSVEDDDGTFINPATGEPLKPGEHYTASDGAEIWGPIDWSDF